MFAVAILEKKLADAGIPVYGVAEDGAGGYRVDFAAGATPAQQSTAAGIVSAFDPIAEQADLDELEAGKVAAQSGAKAWYIATPNSALLFSLTIDGLVAEVDSLDLAALPAATRTKLKLMLKTLAVAVRVLAKKEELI